MSDLIPDPATIEAKLAELDEQEAIYKSDYVAQCRVAVGDLRHQQALDLASLKSTQSQRWEEIHRAYVDERRSLRKLLTVSKHETKRQGGRPLLDVLEQEPADQADDELDVPDTATDGQNRPPEATTDNQADSGPSVCVDAATGKPDAFLDVERQGVCEDDVTQGGHGKDSAMPVTPPGRGPRSLRC